MNWIRQNLKIMVPLAVAAVALVAYLAFAVFGVHTLFIDDKVDDAGPTFDSGAAADDAGDETAGVDTSAPPATTAPPAPTSTAAPVDDTQEVEAPPVTDPPATAAPPTTVAAAPEIVTITEGSFIPRGRHSGEGRALVLNDGTAQRFLRFENFSTDNGPDLSVYLVNSDANADEGTFDDDFIDLGSLRGNIGDQNYEIPPEVDLAVYDTVVVWCVRFGSAFTAADLMPV